VTDAHGDGAPRRAVTLGDVARRAGVSQPTASRVLNGSARQVTEVYRQRVLAAARELGTRRPEGRTAAAHHPHPSHHQGEHATP